jgi:hypothetical protein
MPYADRRTGSTLPKPQWVERWLEVFRDTGNVRLSCHAAGIDRVTDYHYRDADPEFRAAWEQAEEDAVELLEAEARKRARASSDVLMIFLLKAHRPYKYRETTKHEHSGPGGGPIEFSHAATTFDYRLSALTAAEGEGRAGLDALGGDQSRPALPVGTLGEAEPIAAAGRLADLADSGGQRVWEDEDGSGARPSGDREWEMPEDGSGSANGG